MDLLSKIVIIGVFLVIGYVIPNMLARIKKLEDCINELETTCESVLEDINGE
tara:strand:+ start:370 stop:525 length:156 start_codon:yes stop_codon:yes gene_type:complete